VETYQPSRTAFRVALRRAAHQVTDRPTVLDDPIAIPILGPRGAAELDREIARSNHSFSRSLRAFVAVRSRYAEDELATAVERGVKQYVVLGAGLDTFSCRNIYTNLGLRVFEVDHPATQAWKRQLLESANIKIPLETTLVGVDFERQQLPDALQSAGFHSAEGAFFSWLGVVPYLTQTAFKSTLTFIASIQPQSGVVFDYAVARSALSFLERMALDALSARVASAGEPFKLFFEPRELIELLGQLGFRQIEDLGANQLNERYFAQRSDSLRVKGGLGRLVSAQVAARH
jgi:methyltransferase (TIGR00027 family)